MGVLEKISLHVGQGEGGSGPLTYHLFSRARARVKVLGL